MRVGRGRVLFAVTGDRLIVGARARAPRPEEWVPSWDRAAFVLKYKKLGGDVKREEETCPLKFQGISAA